MEPFPSFLNWAFARILPSKYPVNAFRQTGSPQIESVEDRSQKDPFDTGKGPVFVVADVKLLKRLEVRH